MLEAGVNQAVVAREFGVHRSTISRLQSKFRKTNTVADRPRAGRPRVNHLTSGPDYTFNTPAKPP